MQSGIIIFLFLLLFTNPLFSLLMFAGLFIFGFGFLTG